MPTAATRSSTSPNSRHRSCDCENAPSVTLVNAAAVREVGAGEPGSRALRGRRRAERAWVLTGAAVEGGRSRTKRCSGSSTRWRGARARAPRVQSRSHPPSRHGDSAQLSVSRLRTRMPARESMAGTDVEHATQRPGVASEGVQRLAEDLRLHHTPHHRVPASTLAVAALVGALKRRLFSAEEAPSCAEEAPSCALTQHRDSSKRFESKPGIGSPEPEPCRWCFYLANDG